MVLPSGRPALLLPFCPSNRVNPIPLAKRTRIYLVAGIRMAFVLSAGTSGARVAEVIDMSAFGAEVGGSDTTPIVRAAPEQVRRPCRFGVFRGVSL